MCVCVGDGGGPKREPDIPPHPIAGVPGSSELADVGAEREQQVPFLTMEPSLHPSLDCPLTIQTRAGNPQVQAEGRRVLAQPAG